MSREYRKSHSGNGPLRIYLPTPAREATEPKVSDVTAIPRTHAMGLDRTASAPWIAREPYYRSLGDEPDASSIAVVQPAAGPVLWESR